MDLTLLVIAANEGIMPQTREHLGILSLLDVRNGIVVLTKADLVDADWLAVLIDRSKRLDQGDFSGNGPDYSCFRC